MSAKSSIEWTDSSWTPLRARVKENAAGIAEAKGYTSLVQIAGKMAGRVGPHCEHCSPGCDNCYSGTNNSRRLPTNGTGLPFDRRARDLVEPFVDEKILTQPLHWRAPRRIFVCSQTDLFGEFYTDEMIDRVFAVMALCPQHTFQVLTKRAKRMREYSQRIADGLDSGLAGQFANQRPMPNQGWKWPLPQVWLGVSAEDQLRADERIPDLLAAPASVRFLSVEPLLGPVHLEPWLREVGTPGACRDIDGEYWHEPGSCVGCRPRIDWCIVGGESGPGSRAMHPAWVRGIRDQCVAAGVPFFFKQWGEWEWIRHDLPQRGPGMSVPSLVSGTPNAAMARVGKKLSGRLLDGREWNELPAARSAAHV